MAFTAGMCRMIDMTAVSCLSGGSTDAGRDGPITLGRAALLASGGYKRRPLSASKT